MGLGPDHLDSVSSRPRRRRNRAGGRREQFLSGSSSLFAPEAGHKEGAPLEAVTPTAHEHVGVIARMPVKRGA
jgi:hypothetical protein